MTILDNILTHNKTFVEEKKYETYRTTKFPNKKLVVLTCMDTRLSDLLPAAMNIKQGDAKVIKNAGAVISSFYGSITRSILVALYELQAKEVIVVGHHGCGMAGLESDRIIKKAIELGMPASTVDELEKKGINIKQWLSGFERVEDSIANSVNMISSHPLLPKGIPVHGLVIHPETGKLDVVVDGYGPKNYDVTP